VLHARGVIRSRVFVVEALLVTIHASDTPVRPEELQCPFSI